MHRSLLTSLIPSYLYLFLIVFYLVWPFCIFLDLSILSYLFSHFLHDIALRYIVPLFFYLILRNTFFSHSVSFRLFDSSNLFICIALYLCNILDIMKVWACRCSLSSKWLSSPSEISSYKEEPELKIPQRYRIWFIMFIVVHYDITET